MPLKCNPDTVVEHHLTHSEFKYLLPKTDKLTSISCMCACVCVPEDMWPAVVVVATHLQPYIQDGVHTQHMSRVEANSLRTTDLLQTLLNTLLHWTQTHIHKYDIDVRKLSQSLKGHKPEATHTYFTLYIHFIPYHPLMHVAYKM